jgi:hypothetical protein
VYEVDYQYGGSKNDLPDTGACPGCFGHGTFPFFGHGNSQCVQCQQCLASLETKHVDDAVQSVANTPDNLPGCSQVISPSMNSEYWTFSYGQSYTDEDMLVGEGYWIYMQNDCTLVGFTVTPIEPLLD